MSSDILDRLQAALDAGMRPGTGDSNINVYDNPIEVRRGDLGTAIDEIKRLRNELFGLNAKMDSVRSVAGLAVAEPLTFANIKKEVRNGKGAEG